MKTECLENKDDEPIDAKICHVGVYFRDLEGAKAFFEKYFSTKAGEKYHNEKTGFMSYFLMFNEGVANLEIMTRPCLSDDSSSNYKVGIAHISIGVGNRSKVDWLTERLSDDGYKVISGPRTTGDGFYESCVEGPEGCQIEITI